ncbi:MAG TPA: hypothetical protein VGF46_07470 [Gaiellales bacterium]
MRVRFAAIGVLVVAAIEIVARTLAYAFSPDPRAEAFGQVTGGPRPVAVAAIALVLAALFAAAVLFLAALGVRERHRLRRTASPPRLQLRRVGLHTAALFVASSIVFTAVESTIHVEEGLGFHGMHCLVGPVHRDALPLIAALALVAAALIEAVRHALELGRRIAAATPLRRRLPRAARRALVPLAPGTAYASESPVACRDRGPPALSFG